VLRGGGAVLLDASRDGAGTAELQVLVDGREQRVERVPVTTADAGDGDWPLPQLLLAPALADRLGLPSAVQELRVQPAAPVTEAQEERVGRALSADTNFVQVERGFRDDYRIGLIALVAAAAVVTVGAVATSTALAMTDARPDLATMAAVGASRSVRRRMAAVTALVLAATGTALGALAGAVPAVAAIRALQQDDGDLSRFSGAWPLVVPWTNLLLIAGAAPLAAGLLVALFTRARLPVVHRRDA
jgi:putative ABC transport system permease protein